VDISATDFISGYADYADVLEAPRILHEIVGIQLVAAALNRNGVTIPLGAIRYSIDLWALLLSGSGAGRSTTIGMAAPILEAAGMQDLESSVRWGSGASFYQHFSESTSGLHFWGEMGERLKMLNEPQFATAKEWLTDRYDNFKIPPPFRYRVTGKPGDTPPIEFGQAPRINILATSSDDWFFRNLAEEDSTGGFLARWMIMRAEGNRRDVPIPQATNTSLTAPLAARLTQIGQLKGEADLSDILTRYEQWYGETKRRFEAQSNPALAGVYFNRHRGHVLKLAVIFEASQSGTLKVSMRAWERAVKFAEQIEQSIFALLPTGMNAAGYGLQKIEDRIRRAGPSGITQNELTRCFQSMNPKDREQKFKTLIDAGRIYSGVESSGGRPKTRYRHADFHQIGT
jgi:L-amino acid N-acyltransferase YncA